MTINVHKLSLEEIKVGTDVLCIRPHPRDGWITHGRLYNINYVNKTLSVFGVSDDDNDPTDYCIYEMEDIFSDDFCYYSVSGIPEEELFFIKLGGVTDYDIIVDN